MDFKSGDVILNDFDFNEGVALDQQIWSFKEDILQVRYDNKFVLDLGWYPEFNLDDGSFKLIIVEIDDWLNPLFIKRTKSLNEIYEYIKEAILFVEKLK
ncbi:hypothetical protein BBD42_17320 [Paenibacillus sp. BIHB 4019]|uniref:Uncharacterized protein n=1 Tax=Paenibacillus sp. BIHB 4019 TaxID=1870819 RepID=A0A1B2DSX9_9BACL|nr:hypothetical protein BBD42_17320 [Paenibacillus sp. BIHB 4019]